jgi:hypothetical protein
LPSAYHGRRQYYFAKFKIRRSLPCSSHGFADLVVKHGRFGLNEREVLLSMATSKKKVLKRLLSLTLVVVMCFGFIPIPAQATAYTGLNLPHAREKPATSPENFRHLAGEGCQCKRETTYCEEHTKNV